MKRAQEITYIPLTPDGYAKVFASYQKATEEYDKMKVVAEPVIQEFQGSHLEFMSIGAGDGFFENVMVKDQGLLVDYFYGIEPDTFRRENLEKVISSWNTPYFIDHRCFDVDFKTDKKFDFILMSHVLYHFEEPLQAVLKAKSFLKPGGTLLIYHQTKVGTSEVQSQFLQVSTFESAPFTKHILTIESISDDLNKKSVGHRVVTSPSCVDVTDFIRKENAATEYDIISFMLQTAFENLPEDLRDFMYQVVKERCVQEENGRFLFPHDVGMIVIKNN